MTWWLGAVAFANDCDSECFVVARVEACGEALVAAPAGDGEARVTAVVRDSDLGPWTLTRDGTEVYADLTFDVDDAADSAEALTGSCQELVYLAFVTDEVGLSPGSHEWVLSGGVWDQSFEAAAEVGGDDPEGAGCGCAAPPAPAAALGALMLAAGAATTRRRR
jgi:MYXO-CTERM domain-containing protein